MNKSRLEEISKLLIDSPINMPLNQAEMEAIKELITECEYSIGEREYSHQLWLDSIPPDFGTYD